MIVATSNISSRYRDTGRAITLCNSLVLLKKHEKSRNTVNNARVCLAFQQHTPPKNLEFSAAQLSKTRWGPNRGSQRYSAHENTLVSVQSLSHIKILLSCPTNRSPHNPKLLPNSTILGRASRPNREAHNLPKKNDRVMLHEAKASQPNEYKIQYFTTPSKSSIQRRIALTATTTEGFRLLPTQAKYC